METHANERFGIVKKYLDEMDYDALLSQGAPKDEFDCEAQRICSQLPVETTIEELAAIIAREFGHSFNRPEAPQHFFTAAEKIKNECQQTF